MIRPVNMVPLMARLFRSIGDEGRLTVLEALIPREQRVSDIVQATGLSQSTVSTHLSALHAAGLATRRQEARSVWYGASHPAIERLLAASEEVVVAGSDQAYACSSPCCDPRAS
ncbi:MAG TPA: metalloregulator ArsR/SmtB family transcription factor [Chloroflexota bacterium]|nr:metalloregulator ArsR/SmtB family transcription factor [Chloroflexota bacterium]